MVVEITLATTIEATPDQVWEAIADPTTHVEWMADAVAIDMVSPGPVAVGTEMRCLTRVGPFRTNDRLRIVVWDPPARMGVLHEGVITGVGLFTVEGSGDGTRFGWSESLRFPWWLGGPLAERAAKPVLARIWRKNLDSLKELIEVA